MANLTTHYLVRQSTFPGAYRREDIILTATTYGPRTGKTRMGIAGKVWTSTGFHRID